MLLLLFFIGVQLLYNVVLVSAVHQSESAICLHIFPLFLNFLPIQATTEQWVEFPVLFSMFSSVICFKHSINQCIYVNPNLPIHPTPLSILVSKHFFFSLCVSISALKIRSSIPFFWIPIYMVICDIRFAFSDLVHYV